MLRLQCPVQRYAWGKRGLDSMVARVKRVGTHPSGESKVLPSGTGLREWLRQNPTFLGTVAPGYDSDNLVYILKILSIRTALSIQAHPDKTLAAELFVKDPLNYKDANHKPEMVVALTDFEAMCGFRPISEIKRNIVAYPEFAELIGSDVISEFSNPLFCDSSPEEEKVSKLKLLFTNFMTSNADKVASLVSRLIDRLSAGPEDTIVPTISNGITDIADIKDLMIRLNSDFPNDIGVMCPIILNCVKLAPGQSFFMGPSEPHAYVSGDCVECMAPSDNVIRSGLTPKFRDVHVLCNMLNYRTGKLLSAIHPIPIDESTKIYRPPFALAPEFEVEQCQLQPNKVYNFPSLNCCTVILITSGSCSLYENSIAQGGSVHEEIGFEILDAPAGTVVLLKAFGVCSIASGDDGVTIFRAHIHLGDL